MDQWQHFLSGQGIAGEEPQDQDPQHQSHAPGRQLQRPEQHVGHLQQQPRSHQVEQAGGKHQHQQQFVEADHSLVKGRAFRLRMRPLVAVEGAVVLDHQKGHIEESQQKDQHGKIVFLGGEEAGGSQQEAVRIDPVEKRHGIEEYLHSVEISKEQAKDADQDLVQGHILFPGFTLSAR